MLRLSGRRLRREGIGMTIEEHKETLRIFIRLDMESKTDDPKLKSAIEVLSMGLTQEDIEACYTVVQAEIYMEQE